MYYMTINYNKSEKVARRNEFHPYRIELVSRAGDYMLHNPAIDTIEIYDEDDKMTNNFYRQDGKVFSKSRY